MQIRRLVLAARDPAAVRAFYVGVLGLEPAGESGFRVGGAQVELRPASGGTEPVYHVAFHVPANLFDGAKAWFGARAELLREDGKDEFSFPFWNARACYVLDPAGNLIELIALEDLGVERAPPFRPGHVFGVAEVGFPVPDVLDAVARLEAAFGERPRLGLEPDARFTAVGEYDGCLIVVPAGRPWMLTGRPAAVHPLELELAGLPCELRLPGTPYVVRAVGYNVVS